MISDAAVVVVVVGGDDRDVDGAVFFRQEIGSILAYNIVIHRRHEKKKERRGKGGTIKPFNKP